MCFCARIFFSFKVFVVTWNSLRYSIFISFLSTVMGLLRHHIKRIDFLFFFFRKRKKILLKICFVIVFFFWWTIVTQNCHCENGIDDEFLRMNLFGVLLWSVFFGLFFSLPKPKKKKELEGRWLRVVLFCLLVE